MTNYHNDPRELIIEAAERSGLLKEVAALIWFASKYGPEARPAGRCPQCELLDELTEAFDEHVCTPGLVGENVYGGVVKGDGPDILPGTGTEDEAEFEAFYAGFCKPLERGETDGTHSG